MAFSQRQTKSKTLGEVINFGEELEDVFAIGFRNTFSCVFYDELDGSVCGGDTE